MDKLSISTTTTTQPSQQEPAGYATQEEDNNSKTDSYQYHPPTPDTFDSRIDTVTGRFNPSYWRHIHNLSLATARHSLDDSPTIRKPTPPPIVPSPTTPDTDTYTPSQPASQRISRHIKLDTTRINYDTYDINPLPAASRQHLPLLAARKSVPAIHNISDTPPYYVFNRGQRSATKITARKSTVIQKVTAIPDTTTSTPNTNNKRKYKSGLSSSDLSSDTPYPPRFKRDPNA